MQSLTSTNRLDSRRNSILPDIIVVNSACRLDKTALSSQSYVAPQVRSTVRVGRSSDDVLQFNSLRSLLGNLSAREVRLRSVARHQGRRSLVRSDLFSWISQRQSDRSESKFLAQRESWGGGRSSAGIARRMFKISLFTMGHPGALLRRGPRSPRRLYRDK
jgi:hypothetical protein